MKVFEVGDLPKELQAEFAGVVWLDGDLPQDSRYLTRLGELGFRYTEYRALVAVHAGRVLGRIESFILPYRTPTGTEEVLGVSGVVTRPEALRTGVASTLLREAHAREKGTGRRWSFLWTHATWGAHRLYEQLGYHDVFTPPSAVRKVPRVPKIRLAPGYRARRLRMADCDLVEDILQESSRNRVGFFPRARGLVRSKIRLGWRSASDYVLLTKDYRPVGYAYTNRTSYARGTTEAVVTAARHAPALLDLLEHRAAGSWLAFGRTTFVTDHEEMLRRRGYLVYRQSHTTLMARSLRRDARQPAVSDPTNVCQSPRFSIESGSIF